MPSPGGSCYRRLESPCSPLAGTDQSPLCDTLCPQLGKAEGAAGSFGILGWRAAWLSGTLDTQPICSSGPTSRLPSETPPPPIMQFTPPRASTQSPWPLTGESSAPFLRSPVRPRPNSSGVHCRTCQHPLGRRPLCVPKEFTDSSAAPQTGAPRRQAPAQSSGSVTHIAAVAAGLWRSGSTEVVAQNCDCECGGAAQPRRGGASAGRSERRAERAQGGVGGTPRGQACGRGRRRLTLPL